MAITAARFITLFGRKPNLFLEPNGLDVTAKWGRTNLAGVNVVTGVSIPQGATKVFDLVDNATLNAHSIAQVVPITPGAHTTKIFARADTLRYLFVRFYSGGAFSTNYVAGYDLQDGLATNSPTLPVSSLSIVPKGDGWFLCSATAPASATGNGTIGFLLSKDGTGTTYSGSGERLFLANAILNRG